MNIPLFILGNPKPKTLNSENSSQVKENIQVLKLNYTESTRVRNFTGIFIIFLICGVFFLKVHVGLLTKLVSKVLFNKIYFVLNNEFVKELSRSLNISSLAKDPDYVAQLTTEVGAIYDDNTGNMALKFYLLLKVVGFFYLFITISQTTDTEILRECTYKTMIYKLSHP